jgi:CHAD domain-containing protein
MNTKLTLSVDQKVVEQAKAFAKEKHTSLSKMFEEYLRAITSKEKTSKQNLVDELTGIVKESTADYDQIRYEALKSKYGL